MTDHEPGRRRRARALVDRSIRIRVRIYSLIFLVMAVLVVVDGIGIGPRSIGPVLVCLVLGLVAGVVASRMFAMGWDADSGKVVGRIDVVGGVILVGYIAVSIFRGQLIGLWLDGDVAAVAGLAAMAGIMAGQVLGTGRGVGRLFRVVAGREEAAAPPP